MRPTRSAAVPLLAAALTGLVALPAAAAAPVGAAGAGDPYFPLQGNSGYDVGYYDLALAYAPATQQLSASRPCARRPRRRSRRFDLDLRDAMRVSSVTVDGARGDVRADAGAGARRHPGQRAAGRPRVHRRRHLRRRPGAGRRPRRLARRLGRRRPTAPSSSASRRGRRRGSPATTPPPTRPPTLPAHRARRRHRHRERRAGRPPQQRRQHHLGLARDRPDVDLPGDRHERDLLDRLGDQPRRRPLVHRHRPAAGAPRPARCWRSCRRWSTTSRASTAPTRPARSAPSSTTPRRSATPSRARRSRCTTGRPPS